MSKRTVIKKTLRKIDFAYSGTVEIRAEELKMICELALKQLDNRALSEAKEKCWNAGGCIFNSNNSLQYKKCWQEGFSVQQCEFENCIRLKGE